MRHYNILEASFVASICSIHSISGDMKRAKMKSFYERLKANGKHTTSAQIAVIRKLVVVAHSLYKSGQMYDAELYKIATGVLSE